jgi:hypothetical protein
MNFNEIFDEVKLITNRYDIDDKIRAAIRGITLYAHRTDYYWRDRIEAQLTFTQDDTLVAVNVVTSLPRFRAIDYVRYWQPATGILGLMLDKVAPRDVLDDYNYEKLDRYYMAGDLLKLKFSMATRGVQIGYFASPAVFPYASYSSWIAHQFPDLIIQGAVAQIYNQTGKQEEAASINKWLGILPGADPRGGPTLLAQLKQWALEEDAR